MRLTSGSSRPKSADVKGVTVLHASTTVRGDVETEGVLRVDGRLEGSIVRAESVVLGAGGAIVGDVSARQIIVGGTIQGNVSAGTKLEIQPTGIVTGDIRTVSIVIHEGGVVRGQIMVATEASTQGSAAVADDRRPPVALVAKGR